MNKYYKLYELKDTKLYSHFGKREPIELNKEYRADNKSYKLCFANIDHILDYKDEFGLVVCDIEPVGLVIDSLCASKVESECECIFRTICQYIGKMITIFHLQKYEMKTNVKPINCWDRRYIVLDIYSQEWILLSSHTI